MRLRGSSSAPGRTSRLSTGRRLTLLAVTLFALGAAPSAWAVRVPERVPFDPIANARFGNDPVCTGYQKLAWSQPGGSWLGTLSARLECPARAFIVRGFCAHGVVARNNTTLAERQISRVDGWIWIDSATSAICEPAPITFDPANPPGETLFGRFEATFEVRSASLDGPTVFCQGQLSDQSLCQNDIQFKPGEDRMIVYR